MASSASVAAGKGREELAKTENKGSVLEFAGSGIASDSGFPTTFESTVDLRLRQKKCPLDSLNPLVSAWVFPSGGINGLTRHFHLAVDHQFLDCIPVKTPVGSDLECR